MSTYYMKGTLSPKQSIELFEMLLFPIHTLIDMDNNMEKELKKHIINTEDFTVNDYIINTKELINIHNKTLNYISELINNFPKIPNETTEIDFINSYKNSVKSFEKHYSIFYFKLIQLIEKEEITLEEENYFNNNFNKFNEEIDQSLNNFFNKVESFADKFNISLI